MPSTSMTAPLERLAEVLQYFVRADTPRLLCVEVDPRLRAAALTVALASEHLADNRSPLVAIDLPAAIDDDAHWEHATDALREAHEALREAGAPLAPLAERPLRAHGAASLAAQLLQCLGTVRAPAQGLLQVWVPAPGAVDPAWLRRVHELATNPRLGAAKLVVLIGPSEAVAPWLQSIDAATVIHHACVIDEARAQAELAAEIDAEARMGAGSGGAWPSAARPPARRYLAAPASATPPTSAAHDGGPRAPTIAERLRLHVKRANLAMRRGDGPEAVAQQAAARDLCLAEGRVREAVDMELVLGAYLVQLGQSSLAIDAFDRAAERAATATLWPLAAQGHLAAAATHDAAADPVASLASYRAAIAAARSADDARLLLCAYWEARGVAMRLELEHDALALLGDAFVYIQAQPAAQLRGTRAKDVVTELARLLARCRRYSEAREVERSCAAWTAA